MIEINLNTNVEDTNDFRYIVNQKIEECLLRTIRKRFRAGELTPYVKGDIGRPKLKRHYNRNPDMAGAAESRNE